MYRKLIAHLRRWKSSDDRKPLILLGARQVGKTWIMREFGRSDYKSVAYVNCDDEPLAREMFLRDYDINRVLLVVQAITGVSIKPESTLIILDELQEAARGLHCLKYFREKAPQYHVIAAGSLLGITLNRGESFPVGMVDILRVYPMDFEEFLCAIGEESMADIVRSADWDVVNLMGTKLSELLRQYYYVGGMPEVVASFVRKRDLNDVRHRQEMIVETYRRDISKHTTKRESVRIGQVLGSLPSQLAKENKKFIYGLMRPGARAADYELAIQWLVDAGIVHRVCRVREFRQPLKFYEDLSAFKLFFLDCGLLGCMARTPASQVLVGNNVFVEFKGAFTEQYVLQQLVAKGIEPYYWSNSKTPAEIDFVVETSERVVPIEVKAEKNVQSRSISAYISAHPDVDLRAMRFSMLPYKDQGWLENIPLYAIGRVLSDQLRQE